MSHPRGKYLYWLLFLELLFTSISAFAGGYALISGTWQLPPTSWLLHSPFQSYFWPGVILASIVGSTHLLAAVLLFLKQRFAYEAAAVAGLGLLIWIFTEMYIIRQSSFLQTLYFGIGLLTIVLLLVLLRYFPAKK